MPPHSTPVITAISILALADFYNVSTRDRPFAAVTPLVWTTIALNLSIITACIPSIKRFLADWAAGVARGEIHHAYGFEDSMGHSHHSGNNAYLGGSRLSNKLANRLGLGTGSVAETSVIDRSRNREKVDDHPGFGLGVGMHEARISGRRANSTPSMDLSDSVKGPTDGVILHTIDYRVEYEDERTAIEQERYGSSSSSGRAERGMYESSGPDEIGREY